MPPRRHTSTRLFTFSNKSFPSQVNRIVLVNRKWIWFAEHSTSWDCRKITFLELRTERIRQLFQLITARFSYLYDLEKEINWLISVCRSDFSLHWCHHNYSGFVAPEALKIHWKCANFIFKMSETAIKVPLNCEVCFHGLKQTNRTHAWVSLDECMSSK